MDSGYSSTQHIDFRRALPDKSRHYISTSRQVSPGPDTMYEFPGANETILRHYLSISRELHIAPTLYFDFPRAKSCPEAMYRLPANRNTPPSSDAIYQFPANATDAPTLCIDFPRMPLRHDISVSYLLVLRCESYSLSICSAVRDAAFPGPPPPPLTRHCDLSRTGPRPHLRRHDV